MKRFWKKQFTATLLVLAMMVSLVPGAMAAAADISKTVNAGESVSFGRDTFKAIFDAEAEDDTFSWMEFTDLDDLDDYGWFTAKDADNKECDLDSDDAYDGTFYYVGNEATGNDEYKLGSLAFVADEDAAKGVLNVDFRLYGEDGETVDGTMKITVAGADNEGDEITYTVAAGDETPFDPDDFNDAYQKAKDSDEQDIRWVTITISDAKYKNFTGSLACDDETLDADDIDEKFYYSNPKQGTYALEDLYLVAPADAEESTLTLTYKAAYSNTDYVEGTLKLKVEASNDIGTITYDVDPGETFDFDADDFDEAYQDNFKGYLKWIQFTAPSTIAKAGTIYSDYSNEKTVSRTTFNATKYYFDGSSRNQVNDLTFEALKTFNTTLEIPFTASSSTGRTVTGTLEIRSTTGAAGDIVYKVAANKTVVFQEDDFNDFYQDEKNTSNSIKWVEFEAPSSLSSAGTIYSDYGYKAEKSFTRNSLNSAKFYYGSNKTYGDYALADLSFVAASGFKSDLKIPFTAYYSTSKYVEGTLVLQAEKKASYAGDIRYATTTGTKVQINANDIARFFNKSYPYYDLQYVTLNDVPETGSLYYNYYGASYYGASSATKLTAANCGKQNFYFSPTGTSQYALTELTYVPTGTNYCTTIPFTAYGSNRSVSGTILISVNGATVKEVYTTTLKNTPVTFPASTVNTAVTGASGSGVAGIQLLKLPAAGVATVYQGTTTLANTNTTYVYGSTMNQLRIIPAANYTGPVEIPYVALNSNGTAIAAGVVSVGVVNAVKKFSDVTATTWCYKYVTELADAKVIDGYANGTFKPNDTVTYGAALKLVMLAAGYPEQAPTVKGSTFSGYLAKAQADGIVTGTVDLKKPITRLQVAQLAAKAMKLSINNLSTVKPFTDTTDPYVQALNAAGIIEGYFANGTSTYKPGNTLTRGQASAIVWRMRNYNK